MPVLSPLLALTVSTVAHTNPFAPEFAVSTRSVRSASDVLQLDISVTAELAAALESSERVAGVEIQIDKGDGQLAALLQTEIAGTVEMKDSREGYGARTLSFTLQVPPSQSPFYVAWSRGPHRVKMIGYLGLPGAMQPRPMFDGYVTQCSWEAYPSLLRVDCQDVSVLLSSEKLAYNLEPGSLRTRKSVFREILTPYLLLYEIEFGRLDFGSNDGGLLYKGLSEGGTVDLLQWMAAFLTPIARRLTWDGGMCNVEPSYASGPPVRTFRANDINSLSVSLPATTDANAVVMSGTVFGYIGPSGRRTETDLPKIVRALFTPDLASGRQDHTTGEIEDLSLTLEPEVREVSRIVTTRVYDAGTVVMTTVEEWGWYSARACPREQSEEGTVSFNSAFDVYFYADGSCRLEAQQQYQMLRQTVSVKEFNGHYGPLSETVTTTQFNANVVPIAYVDGEGTEIPVPVFLTGEGIGWAKGFEFFVGSADDSQYFWVSGIGDGTLQSGRRARSNNGFGSSQRVTYYLADAQGRIASATTVLKSWGLFYYAIEPPVVLLPLLSAFIFGPPSAKVYAIGGGGFFEHNIAPTAVTTYSAIDETSHKETISFTPYAMPVDLDRLRAPAAPVVGERIVPGGIPILEQPTSGQTAQPASATVVDAVRSGLLGKVVPDNQQNDFCETVDELATCALELLREKAPAVQFDSLADWTVRAGKPVALLLPEVVPVGEVMTAWEVDWSFDVRSGENKQHIAARWLPKELR